MRSSLEKIKLGLQFVLSHPGLFVAFILVVILPLIFLQSGQTFLDAGRANQEKLQRDRVGMLHDSVSILVQQNISSSTISSYLFDLTSLNEDIEVLRVITPTDDGYKIYAAEEESQVGNIQDNSRLFEFSSIRLDESIIFIDTESGERRWTAVRPLRTVDQELYFIYSVQNLSSVDQYMKNAENKAYSSLFIVMLFSCALAWWHVRQVNYMSRYNDLSKKLKTRDDFTNMLVHELRTPLTAMRGYASLITESKDAIEQSKSQANVIEQSAKRLLLLVNDLLDVARIQSGKLTVSKDNISLDKVMKEVVSELAPLAKEHALTLVERSEESFMVIADQVRLKQIFINLISNALKYTKEGGITIVSTKKDNFAEVRIADTGMGIAADDQAKLFAPFFRVSGEENADITGTGLGMWITRELISQMSATIAVESIKGIGTHVVIKIPLS